MYVILIDELDLVLFHFCQEIEIYEVKSLALIMQVIEMKQKFV